ncbi:lytic transglycosylase domain-containing protein [Rhodanobacter sp. DHB23]|uniref:lytic transglycosylase domain-containing protein n=1 Tax=Rhodanobacter sp. DHB23 TaxID=2775923 RepID=UPI00177B7513|nr:lytic transglycosylase domain-containing protein [Rhodanobacter sp. DHB23]MBD8873456.1 lytic transglycosylase domain-containing protein [Rhodanobacter sp. DHB23]
MFAAIGLMACPKLAVSAEVMSHVVDVESGANPYAIGVVGGQLERQPRSLAEALATVRMLDAKGYNYSLGVAQVNRANLGRYGLDSYEKAFDTCPNLAAGAQILAACYASSGGNWGKAFSCYYSGDFVTGYRDGYVQKVYDSINRNRGNDVGVGASQAIPLKAASAAVAGGTQAPDTPDYRVAIRSVSFYTTTTSTPPPGSSPVHDSVSPSVSVQAPAKPSATRSMVSTPSPIPASDASNHVDAATSVFVPQVTGPNDPPPSTPTSPAVSPQSTSVIASSTPAASAQEQSDAAFVF